MAHLETPLAAALSDSSSRIGFWNRTTKVWRRCTAALCDMAGYSGNDEPRKARHGRALSAADNRLSILEHGTVVPE